jgi:RND family efflux transporter MFP subunit
MTTIEFLVEWAVRSAVLILAGALLLWVLRVKAASIRLAAWMLVLGGSVAIPALNFALPKMPFAVMRATAPPAPPVVVDEAAPVTALSNAAVETPAVSKNFDWVRAARIGYALVSGALLLRLATGLMMSIKLRRGSRATGQATEGIEIRESELLASPVTLGIARPMILLPADWRQWDDAKLDAVLAHERSHIRRYDPAVQLLSAIHRAMLWFSPTSWFLHQKLVRVAEEASDDAAVEATCDRALYAGVLLEFMQRGVRGASLAGVPMARYSRPDERIHRILDGTAVLTGVTRWSVAAILALGLPLAYLAAVARPIKAQQKPSPAEVTIVPAAPRVKAPTVALAQRAAAPEPGPVSMAGLGQVSAYTVTIKSRVDGQLMSVSFKAGDSVDAGQLLATIDPRPYELQLAQAEGELAREQAEFATVLNNRDRLNKEQVAQVDGTLKVAQAKVDEAKLQLSYTQIHSPITGVAGLLSVDPGNIVHATDPTGIVVINQLQPIAVLFRLSEDRVPEVTARFRKGANMPVEAWDRANARKLATGRLAGFDNKIDTETGDLKLKAEFDNKDGALFPNQFVNVRLLLNAK